MPGAAEAPKAATRDQLIELAAEVFANEGYASASVRDLTRRRRLTSGAIYANFRNKADLLAAAVDARVARDLEGVPAGRADARIIEIVEANYRSYPDRSGAARAAPRGRRGGEGRRRDPRAPPRRGGLAPRAVGTLGSVGGGPA